MPSPSIPIRNGLCTFVASALLSTGTAFAQEATFNTRQLTPDTALEASRARIERNHVMQDKIAAGSTLFE